jgi:hypothetical protein
MDVDLTSLELILWFMKISYKNYIIHIFMNADNPYRRRFQIIVHRSQIMNVTLNNDRFLRVREIKNDDYFLTLSILSLFHKT